MYETIKLKLILRGEDVVQLPQSFVAIAEEREDNIVYITGTISTKNFFDPGLFENCPGLIGYEIL